MARARNYCGPCAGSFASEVELLSCDSARGEAGADSARTLLQGSAPLLERLGLGPLEGAFLQGSEVTLGLFAAGAQYVRARLTAEAWAEQVFQEVHTILQNHHAEQGHVGELAA